MSTNTGIVPIPTLPEWFEQRVNAIYNSITAGDFDTAFDAFVAKDVNIKVNGQTMSRAQYKKLIRGEIKGDVNGTTSFNEIVSVLYENKDSKATETGAVGAFFTATLFGRIIVLGQTESSTVTSCMNVDVIHDKTIGPDDSGSFDTRRVSSIVEVLTDEQNRVTIPPLPLTA